MEEKKKPVPVILWKAVAHRNLTIAVEEQHGVETISSSAALGYDTYCGFPIFTTLVTK